MSKHRGVRRRGAAAMETAAVMLVSLMFILGIFEYGRFLMDMHLLDNATRQGCRYALVNNTSATIAADVKALVISHMAGEDTSSFTGFNVTVSGTQLGQPVTVNNLVAGDSITVTTTGVYKFMNIIPIFKMPTSFTITRSVTMGCEGAT